MKPCHKQKPSTRSPSRTGRTPPHQTVPVPRAASQPPVHRYVHPIRTVRPAPCSGMEELLAGVLEALSRQADQLEEVLRRLKGDNSDTI